MPKATENVQKVLEAIKELSQEERQQVFFQKNNLLNAKDKKIAELTAKLEEVQKTNTFKETVAKVFKETKDFNHDYTLEAVKLADITSDDTEAQIKEKVANLLNNDKYRFLKQQAVSPKVFTVGESVNDNLNEKPVPKRTLHF